MAADRDIRLRLLIEAVNRTGRSLGQVRTDLTQAADAAARLGAQTAKAGAAGVTGLNRMADSARRLRESLNAADAAAGQLVSAGVQIGLVGAALTAAFLIPIKSAGDFQDSMLGVRAVTGVVGEEFDRLSDKAARLGDTTRYTATEAAEGMRFLGMAGFETTEILDGIGAALDLAAAGQLELAEAADIASNVMTAMQIPATNLSRVVDTLAKTAASANTNVRQAGTALSYVATTAASAGIPLEEATAVIGRLGDAGIHSTRAGTALRAIILALEAPTAQASKTLKKMGVEIARTGDGSLDLTETMRRLGEANLDNASAAAIFRRMAAGAAVQLSKNVDAVVALTRANEESQGAAKEMAEILESGLGGAARRTKAALDGLARAMGDPLLTPLAAVLNVVTSVVRAFSEFAKQHPILAGGITGIVGALGALLVVLGGVFLGVGLLTKAAISLVGAWATLLGGLAKVGVISTLTTAIKAANTALLTFAGTAATTALAFTALAAAIPATIYAFRELNKAQDAVDKAVEAGWQLKLKEIARVKEFNEATGLTAKSYKDIAKLRRDGIVAIDEETRRYYKVGEALRATAKERSRVYTLEEIEKQMELERRTAELRVQLMTDSVKKIRAQLALEVEAFENSEEYQSSTKKQQAAYRAQLVAKFAKEETAFLKKETQDRLQEAQQLAVLEIQLYKAKAQNLLRVEQEGYQTGEQSLEEYLARRRAVLMEEGSRELDALRSQLALAPEEAQPKIEFMISVKEEEIKAAKAKILEGERALIQEQIDLRKEAADMLRAIQLGALGETSADYERRRELMLEQFDAETQAQMEQLANKLDLTTQMDQLDEAYYARMRQRRALDQQLEKQAQLAKLNLWSRYASGAEELLTGLYELSGKKRKEFFYLAKAAALAEAIINTAKAVTMALPNIPMAVIAGALGAVQIAKIVSTNMAKGGPVVGGSGKKDDVHIMGKAGEYMHPVEAVRYYGGNVMEMLRRRMIPKELFSSLQAPQLQLAMPRGRFQAGGGVAKGRAAPTMDEGEGGGNGEIVIINVTDPRELDSYLSTPRGQDAVLNILSSRQSAVRRIIR